MSTEVPQWEQAIADRDSRRWRLTGFADEIGPDFAEQLSVFRLLGLADLEFRSAWGTNVLALDEDQLKRVKRMLDAAAVGVSSIGSPIGKIPITKDFGPHLAKMEHAARLADLFGTRYVRVFSFFVSDADDPDIHRDEVLRRMASIAAVAERFDVIAVHENEKGIYGDIPRRCVDLVESVGSPNLRLVMDPANFVQCGVRPVDDAYALVRPHLEYMHMKDALWHSGQVCVAGEGDGQVRDVVRALRDDGFSGYFSIEPHLGTFDAFGGQCGPELWSRAHAGFVALLRSEGIEFA